MITFFTSCRPFRGEFDALQRRAIRSWKEALPGRYPLTGLPHWDILLMGDARALIDIAEDMEVTYMGVTDCNEHDTPLVNDLFGRAEEASGYDLLCEISSDIVLEGDITGVIETIANVERPFVIGQRYDQERDGTRTLHPPSAADYFIFRRGTLGDIPPFAIGRTGYDNWLIWAAKERWGLTVIDATKAITAVHQNHSYPEYGDRQRMLQSAERQENLRLAYETGMGRWHNVTDAPFVLNGKGVQPRG